MTDWIKIDIKDVFQSRIFGIRPTVLLLLIVGISLLVGAVWPDSNARNGWLLQFPKDAGYIFIGVVFLYISHLSFSYIRMHKLKKNPDEYGWKHIVFASVMLFSCAHIIASILG